MASQEEIDRAWDILGWSMDAKVQAEMKSGWDAIPVNEADLD